MVTKTFAPNMKLRGSFASVVVIVIVELLLWIDRPQLFVMFMTYMSDHVILSVQSRSKANIQGLPWYK